MFALLDSTWSDNSSTFSWPFFSFGFPKTFQLLGNTNCFFSLRFTLVSLGRESRLFFDYEEAIIPIIDASRFQILASSFSLLLLHWETFSLHLTSSIEFVTHMEMALIYYFHFMKNLDGTSTLNCKFYYRNFLGGLAFWNCWQNLLGHMLYWHCLYFKLDIHDLGSISTKITIAL